MWIAAVCKLISTVPSPGFFSKDKLHDRWGFSFRASFHVKSTSWTPGSAIKNWWSRNPLIKRH